MADDVQAGRLHLDAYVDTTGTAKGLQRRLDAELTRRNIRAKIKAEIDTKGIVGEARKAAAEATKAAGNVRIKIRAEIDRRSLATDIRAAVKEASAANVATVKIKAEIDRRGITKGITDSVKDATSKVDIDVDSDTAGARAKIQTLRQTEQAQPITIPVTVSAAPLQAASTALGQLSQIPLMVGGFYTLGTAIVQIGGGLVAMASSATMAATALAAIPNLIGVAGQGIGVLIAGFSGIGDAVKGLQQAEQQGAQTARASSLAREAAYDRVRQAAESLRDAEWALARSAESVRDAREALSDAHYNAAEASEQAAERIKDAEESVRQSILNSTAAQVGLTRAREQAQQRIAAMNRELRLSVADEAAAAEAVNLARERLQDVTMDASSSQQDRRGAVVDLLEAEAALERQTAQQEALRDATDKANKDGVAGSDEVKDAQAAVKAALEDEKDAVEALADAREQAKRQAMMNARSIRDATENVRDALHAQGEAAEAVAAAHREIGRAAQAANDPLLGASAATTALNEAMDNLGPAGQRFAKFIQGTLLPRLKQMRLAIQEAILPGIQQGITNAMPFLTTLQTGLVETSTIVGDFATELGALMGTDDFNFDVSEIMASNNRALEDFLAGAKDLVEVFTDIAFVAGPTLVEPFAKWTKTVTESWKASAQLNRENGDMQASFEKSAERATTLKDIISNLGQAMWDLIGAAAPSGDRLLESFEKTTEGWATWAESDAGQKRMQEFFESTESVTTALGDLISQFAELMVKLSEGNSGPLTILINSLTKVVEAITWFLDLHPAIGTAIGTLMTMALVGGAIGKLGSIFLGIGANISKFLKVLPGGTKLLAAMTRGFVLLRTYGQIAAHFIKGVLVDAIKFLARQALVAVKALGKMALTLAKSVVNGAVAAAKAMGKLVVTMARAAAAALATTARFLAQRAAMIAMRLATIAQTIATAALAAAQRLSNIAFLASPMGLIILGVVALIAIFVLLYKKVSWFRKGVNAAIDGIVSAFQWVRDVVADLWDEWFGHSIFPDMMKGFQALWGVVQKVFGFVMKIFRTVGTVARWLWNNAIMPAMNGIRAAISAVWPIVKTIFTMWVSYIRFLGSVVRWLWSNVIVPAFNGIKTAIGVVWAIVKVYINAWRLAIRVLANVVRWLWRNIVVPAFNGIKRAIGLAWSGIKGYIGALRAILRAVGAVFKWLWNKVVTPVWAGIKSAINTVWTFLKTKVFDPLVKMVKTTIPNAFDSAVKGIKTIWDGLKEIAKAPVKFVIDTVYNNGLRKMIGLLPGVDTPDKVNLNWAKGTSAVMPGYTPGRDVHNFVSTDGRMSLGLSGGEGILRPEVVRQMGPRAIDALNAAARKGGSALSTLLTGGGHSAHNAQGYANGGIIGRAAKRLSFFLGGIMPLQAGVLTGEHALPYYGTGATFAGDLNGPLDLANPPAKVFAWKKGTVAHVAYGNDSHGRYGNHVAVNHPGGGSSWYAHLSSIMARVGQQVLAGDMLGRVGATGNASGAHLHMEVRGMPAAGGTSGVPGTGGLTLTQQAQQKDGEKEGDGWKNAISSILGVIKKGTGWISHIKNKTGPWGGMIAKSAGSIGGSVRNWINNKIPDQIKLPGKIPDIPLPDNPIPKLFDAGGRWATNTLGVNMSGKTETVFTNEQMVTMSTALAETSRMLRSSIVTRESEGGLPALVEHLSITGRPDEIPGLLSDANMELRRIRRGGLHATRTAP